MHVNTPRPYYCAVITRVCVDHKLLWGDGYLERVEIRMLLVWCYVMIVGREQPKTKRREISSKDLS